MYYNKSILIGFLGSDAEQRTTKNGASYTVLSLATKRSWKNDQGNYESRTYWHRAVAWNKLAEFAATLKIGSAPSTRRGASHPRVREGLRQPEEVHRQAARLRNRPGVHPETRPRRAAGRACPGRRSHRQSRLVNLPNRPAGPRASPRGPFPLLPCFVALAQPSSRNASLV